MGHRILTILAALGILLVLITILGTSYAWFTFRQPEPPALAIVHGLGELGAGQGTITETLVAVTESFIVYRTEPEGTSYKTFRVEVKGKMVFNPDYNGSDLFVGLALVLKGNPDDELVLVIPITGRTSYGSSTQGLIVVLEPKAP